jgi:hypothetical protein
MEALRGSIAQENASKAPQKRLRRVEDRGEMLLPIPGKKGKRATAKAAERASPRWENAGLLHAETSKTPQQPRLE